MDELDALIEKVSVAVAARVATLLDEREVSPWLTLDEAVAYSKIKEGTFRKMVADGRVPSHGDRSKRFHKDELDAALRAL